MQLLWLPTLFYLFSSVCAASLPRSIQLSVREPALEPEYVDPREFSALEKRKGGGGGKGGGSGRGGGSSSSSGGRGRSPSSYSFSYIAIISYPPCPLFHSISLLTSSSQHHPEHRWPYDLRLWPQARVQWSLCWRCYRALHFRSTLSHARLPPPRPPDNGLRLLPRPLALRLPLRVSLPLTVLVLRQWSQSNRQRHLSVPEIQRVRV